VQREPEEEGGHRQAGGDPQAPLHPAACARRSTPSATSPNSSSSASRKPSFAAAGQREDPLAHPQRLAQRLVGVVDQRLDGDHAVGRRPRRRRRGLRLHVDRGGLGDGGRAGERGAQPQQRAARVLGVAAPEMRAAASSAAPAIAVIP
jgi:hypothetical protein